ncbi:hypothetical protein AB0B48_04490 [Micromonospora sp. NPDC049089]|uniref:hypothetical protein n=1 Tax=Micromonospora sp. NPDC049089 TaxID=3155496 RepID=UPI0033E59C63
MTETFIDVARDLSRSELYGYGEADRGTFDFACCLTANHARQVIGQTLTHHAAGIDKDLASLLLESTTDVPVYLYSYDARNEGRIQEFLHRARRSLPDRVGLLRLFRYPAFDADIDSERTAVARAIRNQVLDDLVMNILFGRLQAADVSLFLQGTSISGLLLAALEHIALNGFFNFPELGRSLGANPTTLRPRVQTLLTAGLLVQMPGNSMFSATPRAGIFLRICSLLARDRGASTELAYILDRLDLGNHRTHPSIIPAESELLRVPYSADGKRLRLLNEIRNARERFGADLTSFGFQLADPHAEPGRWIGR